MKIKIKQSPSKSFTVQERDSKYPDLEYMNNE